MPLTEEQKEKYRVNAQKRYKERKMSGLWSYCDNPREGEHIRCAIHREIAADYCAGRRDIFKLKGLCGSCGRNKPESGLVNCRECLEKSKLNHRNRYQRRSQ